MLNARELSNLMTSSIVRELKIEFPNGVTNFQLKIAKAIAIGVSYTVVLFLRLYSVIYIDKKTKTGRFV